MLVLSRKAGERLLIGPNIVVTVLDVHGSAVKLGCEAPRTVSIRRAEIAEQSDSRKPESKRQPTESPFFAECA